MLGYKLNVNKFWKINIIQSIFFDYNMIQLQINNRNKTGKLTNVWKLKNILLNNQSIKEITREIRKYLDTDENEIMAYKNVWNAVKAVLGKFIVINAHTKK